MNPPTARENWLYVLRKNQQWIKTPGLDNIVLGRAYSYCGVAHYHLGNYAKARRYFDLSLIAHDDPGVHTFMARCLIAQGNFDEGMEHYLITLKHDIGYVYEVDQAARQNGYQLALAPIGKRTYEVRAIA